MNHIVYISDFDTADYQALKDSKAETTDLYLSYCGIERCHPSHRYANALRTDFVIHFILKGKGTFCLGSKAYKLQEKQAFLITAGTSDYSYTADEREPWMYMWIGFNGKQAPSYLSHTGFSTDSPVCNINNMDEIYHVIQNLLKTKALTLSNDIKRDSYLYKILSLLIVSFKSVQARGFNHDYPAKTYAIYAKNYIDHNFTRTNITDIAKMIGVDRSYLHNVFKKSYHLSPQEYLIQSRLKYAEELLNTTNLPIKQVACESGYEDSLQFSKIFKKYYGQSPRAFRSDSKTRRTD